MVLVLVASQLKLREGCNAVLRADCIELLRRLVRSRQAALFVRPRPARVLYLLVLGLGHHTVAATGHLSRHLCHLL